MRGKSGGWLCVLRKVRVCSLPDVNKYDGIKKEYEMIIKELCAESTYDTKLTEIFRELIAA